MAQFSSKAVVEVCALTELPYHRADKVESTYVILSTIWSFQPGSRPLRLEATCVQRLLETVVWFYGSPNCLETGNQCIVPNDRVSLASIVDKKFGFFKKICNFWDTSDKSIFISVSIQSQHLPFRVVT